MGKTWLIREFGRRRFDKTAYVTFFDNENAHRIFDGSVDARRIVDALSIETGVRIDAHDTLLILDEVQECPRALMSLKSFAEQMPELAVIAAGSLLGVALSRGGRRAGGAMFPVGKVSWLTLYPMTFIEYLRATEGDALASTLARGDLAMAEVFREKLTDALRRYYYVGGMPEAVSAFASSHDLRDARSVQNDLLLSYEHDFSKYATASEAERIRLVWRSVPSQLARENRKFVYSAVRPSGRARDFEAAIQWLVDAGLLTKVPRISKPGLPLSAYEDLGAFKLFLLDTGLLGARSRLPASAVIEGDRLFSEFKGALSEQYVCQQMVASGLEPWYWSAERSDGEVDFLFERGGIVHPMEVKAEENLRAKSLRAFCARYDVGRALRLSMSGYRREEWLTNVPLYAAGCIGSLT